MSEALSNRNRSTPCIESPSFDALEAHYRRRIFGISYRLLRNREDAEDQTQEVFLKIYRVLHTLGDVKVLDAWITRVTINACLDAIDIRTHRPVTTSIDASEYQECLASAPGQQRLLTPEEAALRAELCRSLAAAFQRLDCGAQQCLVFRDYEGLTYQEIGELLAIGPSAVKMRIRRARQAFRRALCSIDPTLGEVTA